MVHTSKKYMTCLICLRLQGKGSGDSKRHLQNPKIWVCKTPSSILNYWKQSKMNVNSSPQNQKQQWTPLICWVHFLRVQKLSEACNNLNLLKSTQYHCKNLSAIHDLLQFHSLWHHHFRNCKAVLRTENTPLSLNSDCTYLFVFYFALLKDSG